LRVALDWGDVQRLLAFLPDDAAVPSAELPESLLDIWRAWWRLHADRPQWAGGMGPPIPGRIPFRDVWAWCEFHGLPGDDVALFDRCLRAMDTVYLEWHAERMKAANNGRVS